MGKGCQLQRFTKGVSSSSAAAAPPHFNPFHISRPHPSLALRVSDRFLQHCSLVLLPAVSQKGFQLIFTAILQRHMQVGVDLDLGHTHVPRPGLLPAPGV